MGQWALVYGPQTENPERRAEPRPRKGVKMAPISETEKDSLGLFSTGAHALASQTPIYSGVLTFPFEAHKVQVQVLKFLSDLSDRKGQKGSGRTWSARTKKVQKDPV